MKKIIQYSIRKTSVAVASVAVSGMLLGVKPVLAQGESTLPESPEVSLSSTIEDTTHPATLTIEEGVAETAPSEVSKSETEVVEGVIPSTEIDEEALAGNPGLSASPQAEIVPAEVETSIASEEVVSDSEEINVSQELPERSIIQTPKGERERDTNSDTVSERARQASEKVLGEQMKSLNPEDLSPNKIVWSEPGVTDVASSAVKVDEVKELLDKIPTEVRSTAPEVRIFHNPNSGVLGTASSAGRVSYNLAHHNLSNGDVVESSVLLHEIGHTVDFKSFDSSQGALWSFSRDDKVQPLLQKTFPRLANYEAWASIYAIWAKSYRSGYEPNTPQEFIFDRETSEEINNYFDTLFAGTLLKARPVEVPKNPVEIPNNEKPEVVPPSNYLEPSKEQVATPILKDETVSSANKNEKQDILEKESEDVLNAKETPAETLVDKKGEDKAGEENSPKIEQELGEKESGLGENSQSNREPLTNSSTGEADSKSKPEEVEATNETGNIESGKIESDVRKSNIETQKAEDGTREVEATGTVTSISQGATPASTNKVETYASPRSEVAGSSKSLATSGRLSRDAGGFLSIATIFGFFGLLNLLKKRSGSGDN